MVGLDLAWAHRHIATQFSNIYEFLNPEIHVMTSKERIDLPLYFINLLVFPLSGLTMTQPLL